MEATRNWRLWQQGWEQELQEAGNSILKTLTHAPSVGAHQDLVEKEEMGVELA